MQGHFLGLCQGAGRPPPLWRGRCALHCVVHAPSAPKRMVAFAIKCAPRTVADPFTPPASHLFACQQSPVCRSTPAATRPCSGLIGHSAHAHGVCILHPLAVHFPARIHAPCMSQGSPSVNLCCTHLQALAKRHARLHDRLAAATQAPLPLSVAAAVAAQGQENATVRAQLRGCTHSVHMCLCTRARVPSAATAMAAQGQAPYTIGVLFARLSILSMPDPLNPVLLPSNCPSLMCPYKGIHATPFHRTCAGSGALTISRECSRGGADGN